MKTINKIKYLLILSLFCGICNAQSYWNIVTNWKDSVLQKIPTNKLDVNELNKLDFSKIWIDNRTCYLGYIGNNFQRLHIEFIGIQKKNDTEYFVEGKSKVNLNECNFSGIFKIEDIRALKNKEYGVDNLMEGKIKEQGIIIVDVNLKEDSIQRGSGIFKGLLITQWYLDNDNNLLYDDVRIDSDDYSNNQFLGTWISYKTNVVKQCAWGHYRIPHSGDLDIGAGEFSVNEKYINNGWARENICNEKNE